MERCTVCGSERGIEFFHLDDVPIECNVLWDAQADAVAVSRGDIRLHICPMCGHIWNAAFDPARLGYSGNYENSLHFSPRFQQYAQDLATDLVERYQLYGKKVIEIGSGKGDFLNLLCEAGQNNGVGFDPSYDGAGSPFQHIRFEKTYFDAEHAAESGDLICARHVLEHIPQPAEFANMLHDALQSQNRQTVVFIEVPNAAYMLKECALWDVIYEHCSYFTPQSLARLFTEAGFDVNRVQATYEGQFLTLEATLAQSIPGVLRDSASPPSMEAGIAELVAQARAFDAGFQEKVAYWQAEFTKAQVQNQRIMLWGAGSKGISFLNFLHISPRQIPYIVDINPRKRFKFVTGSGQQIIPPDFLRQSPPERVIIMNPIYETEISETLRELDLHAEVSVA